jgi:hypothetical protein
MLFILFILPVFTHAQINRSAKELASEKIQEYITAKLFINKPYRVVSFGEIKEVGVKKKDEIVWSIAHKFEITDGGKKSFDNSPEVSKQYNFLFYLDEKMKVLKAETFYSNR